MLIEAEIFPNKRKFAVEIVGNRLRIYVESPPEKGKANREIVKKLRKMLSSEIRIIRGEKSKNKVLEIGLRLEEIREKVESASKSN